MYSRYPNYRFSGGVRVPDNYSGNAFKPESQNQNVEAEAVKAERLEAVAEQIGAAEAVEPIKEKAPEGEGTESVSAFKAEKSKFRFPSFNFNVGKLFSGGFGFEELLIIGLILLISQNGADDDIILLLALLLFIG
ncbi:MAG: hypothetical protein IJV72_01675 [Clostridia bacterium]|nr:hypothetical protein [Clostridia bacterium]